MNVLPLHNSLLEKFSVIVKQKDRFGVIFQLLWLSEHTQGGEGVVSGGLFPFSINIYFLQLELEFDLI